MKGKVVAESPTWDYDSIAKGYKAPDTPAEGQIAIPTWKSEMYFEYHRGVMTTQANHKRNMRESEEWALNAEKYASARLGCRGNTYPGVELTDAWKKIAFNVFHDLGAGSGIGIIYKEAQSDYDQVHWATNEISHKALSTLSSDVKTQVPGGVPVLVYNPLGWERSGSVMVDVQMPSAASGGVSVIDAENRIVPSEIVSSDEKTNSYKLMLDVNDVPSLG